MDEMSTTVVYAGQRITSRGKLGYFYEHADGQLRGYANPLSNGAQIGTQIALTASVDGGYWGSGPAAPRATGHLNETDPRLLRWSIEEKGDVVRLAELREQQHILKTGSDPIRSQLQPLREYLQRLPPDRKAGAVAWIMTFLQGAEVSSMRHPAVGLGSGGASPPEPSSPASQSGTAVG